MDLKIFANTNLKGKVLCFRCISLTYVNDYVKIKILLILKFSALNGIFCICLR